MAKNEKDLEKSRAQRKEIIQKYGGVPLSVWDIVYTKNYGILNYVKTQNQYSLEKEKEYRKKGFNKKDAGGFGMSGKGSRGGQTLSIFPPRLAKKAINFYSNPGNLVLDPFCGHNSRMQMANALGRGYIGYDVCKEFMIENRKIAKRLQSGFDKSRGSLPIILREQSSEKMEEGNDSIDLIFTSPPYYNIEYYGPEAEQLGNTKSYKEFLGKMGTVVAECYRVLKEGKFCVFNINDFILNGKFYMYHADIARLFEISGFKLWDIIIIKWTSCVSQAFASQIEERKRTAKMHEYIIVGKK